jgi:hypothetical protein
MTSTMIIDKVKTIAIQMIKKGHRSTSRRLFRIPLHQIVIRNGYKILFFSFAKPLV